MKKILLIEDLPQKADEIKFVIHHSYPKLEVKVCTSYHTAIEELYNNYKSYSLVFLDMSMSTFDVGTEENGGLPETLAGKRILDGMYLRDIPLKVKVVTMFESFDGKNIHLLDEELREENPENYDGYIFFSFKKK